MAERDYLRAFLYRGKNRLLILDKLKEGEKTQAQLFKETGIYRSHITRALKELEEKELVKCLNPKDRIYKIYVITLKARNIMKDLH